MLPEIERVFDANDTVVGVREVWHQTRREGVDVARRTVARLMKDCGFQGVIRGRPHRATIPDKSAPCPQDKGNRQFRVSAPDMLRVSHVTCVAIRAGSVYVAFVVDAQARRIVGWRVSRTAHAGFVLDALDQAVHRRRPGHGPGHPSDRGSRDLSFKDTERPAGAGIRPSVVSVGDGYENALAETIDGLSGAGVLHRRGPWRSLEAVDLATLDRDDGFNDRRLLEPIGTLPPAEAGADFSAALDARDVAAQLGIVSPRRTSARFTTTSFRKPQGAAPRASRRSRCRR